MPDVGTEFMQDVKSIPKPLWIGALAVVVVGAFVLRRGSSGGSASSGITETAYPDLGAGSQGTDGGASSGSGSDGGADSSGMSDTLAALMQQQSQQGETFGAALSAMSGAVGTLAEQEASNQNTLADLVTKLHTMQERQQVAINRIAASPTTLAFTPSGANTDPRVGNEAGMYTGPASNVDLRDNPSDNHNTDYSDTNKIVVYDNPSYLDQASRQALWEHNTKAAQGA